MDANNSLLVAGLLRRLFSVPASYWVLWCGLLVLSVAVIVLLRARWGQSRPLHKCAVLSLLVHLVLAFLAMTIRIVTGDGGGGGGGGPPIRVRIVNEAASEPVSDMVAETETTTIEPPQLLEPPAEQPAEAEHDQPDAAEVADAEPIPPEKETVEQIEEPDAQEEELPPLEETSELVQVEPVENPAPLLTIAEMQKDDATESTATAKPVDSPSQTAASTVVPPLQPVAPPIATTATEANPNTAYALRNSPGRLSVVQGEGGNAETEAAVTAALAWLAQAQSRDGRWDANHFGAGQEQLVLGQDRGGAGRNADTGVSALALLAFMGAGHSHLDGAYRDTVHRGLDFLLRSQAADGSLFGNATLYAQMYCHSMATFALAEAQAMTGDRRLEPAVTKAVNFSLRAQNGTNGGWRYRPGDSGDTSQLGWQMMALASAERAGIRIPDETWRRVDRFLRTVRRGNFSGLASYRPDSPASTSMTGEALYCRLLLDDLSKITLDDAAANEATARLLADLPKSERVNLYYWYYATLALHHRHVSSTQASDAWRVWNDALTVALVSTQVSDGKDAGSWNINTVWGGYGGRVYTTAMATMCLEVYYRYAPTPASSGWTANRPQQSSPR
jgi:outer membrane biosynthesis protein TonB